MESNQTLSFLLDIVVTMRKERCFIYDFSQITVRKPHAEGRRHVMNKPKPDQPRRENTPEESARTPSVFQAGACVANVPIRENGGVHATRVP